MDMVMCVLSPGFRLRPYSVFAPVTMTDIQVKNRPCEFRVPVGYGQHPRGGARPESENAQVKLETNKGLQDVAGEDPGPRNVDEDF